jgi:hypothetical protein
VYRKRRQLVLVLHRRTGLPSYDIVLEMEDKCPHFGGACFDNLIGQMVILQVFTEAFQVGTVPLDSPGAFTFSDTAEKKGLDEVVKGWCGRFHDCSSFLTNQVLRGAVFLDY